MFNFVKWFYSYFRISNHMIKNIFPANQSSYIDNTDPPKSYPLGVNTEASSSQVLSVKCYFYQLYLELDTEI